MQLPCPPVRWRGPLLALAGAAAVAGIAIGVTLGGGAGTTVETRADEARSTSTVTRTTSADSTATGGTTNTVSSATTSNSRTTATTTHPGATPLPRTTNAGHRLLVATVDDALKQADPATAAALTKLSHDAGFDAVMVSSAWTPGARAPSPQEKLALANVVKAAGAQRMHVFVFVWHGLSAKTPRTAGARAQFAAYT